MGLGAVTGSKKISIRELLMQKVQGNTNGIRRSYIERLESIFDMEIDRDQFCTGNILNALASFTESTGREAMGL